MELIDKEKVIDCIDFRINPDGYCNEVLETLKTVINKLPTINVKEIQQQIYNNVTKDLELFIKDQIERINKENLMKERLHSI
jgi:hypothetical protein